MGAEIKDEYSLMPISRQRKYYLRQRRRGRCTKCGKAAAEGSLCLEHLIQMREHRREKYGLKRRYTNSLSYRAAEKVETLIRFGSETLAAGAARACQATG